MKFDYIKSKIIFLHPGEAIFSKKPIIVSTVLGSCVSITMYNARTKMAGISHCQLPKCPHRATDCIKHCVDPYKYVDCTIEKMLEKFKSNKIAPEEIEIKIFGGGDVLTTIEKQIPTQTVGQKNLIAADEMFKKHRLKVAAKDVGGKTGRKLFFVADSGEIYLNRLKNYEEN